MAKVRDACVLFDLEVDGMDALVRSIGSVFKELEIEFRANSYDHHISLAYLVGEFDLDKLTDISKCIAVKPPKLKLSGIEILQGVTTDRDYIVFKVLPDDELDDAIEFISEQAPVRLFDTERVVHMSVMTIDKLEGMDHETVSRFLEIQTLGLFGDIKLRATGISIFDKNKDRIAQIPIGSAI